MVVSASRNRSKPWMKRASMIPFFESKWL